MTIKGGDADPATSYNTVSIAPVAGRLATACASLAKRKEDAALTDGAGVSIFVSDPVPPGEAREIAGTWTFRLYMWATSHPRLSMRAKIYLIQVDGTTKELAEAHDNKRRDLALSPQEVTWAYDMPAGTILNAGERFGVQFLIHPEGDQWLQYAYLGFDHGTVPSGVKVPWPLWAKPETTPPARNPEGETAHLREPDCSMSWPLPWLTPSPQAVPAPTPRPASIPAPAPKPAPMLTPTLDSGLVEAGGLALAAAAAQGITFDRRLTGEKVGQHKVPPFLPVTIEIQATVSEAMPAAALADYFPASWGVQDRQGGTVSPVDAETSRISWLVGDLAVGQTVTRSYVLTPPDRTIPPTFYTFVSELSAGPTIVQSA
ncbi:MAG TPA: hypothetical protein VJ256_06805, partial [Dehalococcoidia bacterium]|nr:hypothetical protein [Dehalococcoidia bacterium]